MHTYLSDIKAAFGVPQLVVDADPPTIEVQTGLGGKVSFIEALKLGIQSFLEDGRNYDSPVGTILADPEAFELPEVPNNGIASSLIRDWMHDSNADFPYDANIAPAATAMVRSWMNDPDSKMILCTPDYQYLPENGETVEDNWIFRLDIDRYTPSIHWAIIDRSGVKLPYNYGYG